MATVPTSTVTSLTALSLPQPLLCPSPCPCPAQFFAARPLPSQASGALGHRSLLVHTRAARTQEYSYFLPCAPPAAKTSPTTARRQPAQQTFLRSFSFPFNKTVLPTDRLSKSLAQILAPLSTKSQPLAAHLTPAPQGQLSPRGCRLGPGHSGHSLPPPPPGTHRSAPNSAARGRVPKLRATRTCPWRRNGRESKRVGPEGPGAGRGAAEHGASRAPEPVGGWGPAGNEGASEVGCSFYSRAERVT